MAMKNQFRSKRRGALTLEWILLVTVLVIGIIGGMAAVRNATNGELLETICENNKDLEHLPGSPLQ